MHHQRLSLATTRIHVMFFAHQSLSLAQRLARCAEVTGYG